MAFLCTWLNSCCILSSPLEILKTEWFFSWVVITQQHCPFDETTERCILGPVWNIHLFFYVFVSGSEYVCFWVWVLSLWRSLRSWFSPYIPGLWGYNSTCQAWVARATTHLSIILLKYSWCMVKHIGFLLHKHVCTGNCVQHMCGTHVKSREQLLLLFRMCCRQYSVCLSLFVSFEVVPLSGLEIFS